MESGSAATFIDLSIAGTDPLPTILILDTLMLSATLIAPNYWEGQRTNSSLGRRLQLKIAPRNRLVEVRVCIKKGSTYKSRPPIRIRGIDCLILDDDRRQVRFINRQTSRVTVVSAYGVCKQFHGDPPLVELNQQSSYKVFQGIIGRSNYRRKDGQDRWTGYLKIPNAERHEVKTIAIGAFGHAARDASHYSVGDTVTIVAEWPTVSPSPYWILHDVILHLDDARVPF
jgi:hypothetical protein